MIDRNSKVYRYIVIICYIIVIITGSLSIIGITLPFSSIIDILCLIVILYDLIMGDLK